MGTDPTKLSDRELNEAVAKAFGWTRNRHGIEPSWYAPGQSEETGASPTYRLPNYLGHRNLHTLIDDARAAGFHWINLGGYMASAFHDYRVYHNDMDGSGYATHSTSANRALAEAICKLTQGDEK